MRSVNLSVLDTCTVARATIVKSNIARELIFTCKQLSLSIKVTLY